MRIINKQTNLEDEVKSPCNRICIDICRQCLESNMSQCDKCINGQNHLKYMKLIYKKLNENTKQTIKI